MAFLDNSGDIILDAVLTDEGRRRLSRGTFNIAKFALGDEEINYALWDTSNANGSQFYDLKILQTPILEAFTNNQSIMKSRLLTIERENILFMPVLRLNDTYGQCKPHSDINGFYLLADRNTYEVGSTGEAQDDPNATGFLHGVSGYAANPTSHICIDQGIEASDSYLTLASPMPDGLYETSYIVKVDHRLIRLEGFLGQGVDPVMLEHRSIDDDSIASYYIVESDSRSPIVPPSVAISGRNRGDLAPGISDETIANIRTFEMFDGPLGSVLRLVPRVAPTVAQGNSLFNEIGSDGTSLSYRGRTIDTYKYIDTTISVAGATTGFSIDIPIRILKGLSFS